jgi:hypothetical protein
VLVIQQEMRMRVVAIYGLSGCTILSKLPNERQDFRKRRKFIELKIVF